MEAVINLRYIETDLCSAGFSNKWVCFCCKKKKTLRKALGILIKIGVSNSY